MKTTPQTTAADVLLNSLAKLTTKNITDERSEHEVPEWLKLLHSRWGGGIALLDPGPAPTPFDGSENPQDAWA